MAVAIQLWHSYVNNRSEKSHEESNLVRISIGCTGSHKGSNSGRIHIARRLGPPGLVQICSVHILRGSDRYSPLWIHKGVRGAR